MHYPHSSEVLMTLLEERTGVSADFPPHTIPDPHFALMLFPDTKGKNAGELNGLQREKKVEKSFFTNPQLDIPL